MTPPLTTVTAPEPAALFDLAPASAEPVSGIPAGRFDPATYDATLTGDGYDWLNGLLAAPQPPACEGCGQPMSLPAAAPVLWACPACHPDETT
jgi:hypothetical protein